MNRIGLPEILLVVVVILVLFGARRLPEIGNSIGKAIREFQKALKGDRHDEKDNKDI